MCVQLFQLLLTTFWISENGSKCQLSFIFTLVLLLFPKVVNSLSSYVSQKMEKKDQENTSGKKNDKELINS